MKYTVGHSQSLSFAFDLSPDPLLAKLQELADLPDGWRFGEGVPPRPQALDRAREIHRQAASLRLKADAFPSADGSVNLVFYAGERCVEIYVSQTGTINVSVEEGEGFDFREIKKISNASITDAVEEVNFLAQKSDIWNLLDSFIHESTISIQSASAVHVSPTPATGQEYHLLILNASESTVRPYASTSNAIIPVS